MRAASGLRFAARRGFATTHPEVCVIGASVMDMIAYADRIPKVGETILGTGFNLGFGGKGANQAVQAGLLGTRTAMISKVGEDSFGRDTVDNFKRMGVDAAHVSVSGEGLPTGSAAIMVDKEGSNSICVVMGANNGLTTDDVHAADATIAGAKVLLAQLEVPMDVSLAALQAGRRHGVLTVLNTAPAPSGPLDPAFYAAADIVCPNETEIEMLVPGCSTQSLESVEDAARKLLDMGPSMVIVTLGKRGAMMVTNDAVEIVEGTDDKAMDTVGAGDSFMGAFAAFVAQGCTHVEAIRRANVASGRSVTKAGTQTSYPSRAELPADLFSA